MSRISITHNERTGEPVFIDVHHRHPGGAVTPAPLRTYQLEPGEARTIEVHCAQVLVVREAPELRPGEV